MRHAVGTLEIMMTISSGELVRAGGCVKARSSSVKQPRRIPGTAFWPMAKLAFQTSAPCHPSDSLTLPSPYGRTPDDNRRAVN
jgi:hypothetical protein